MSFKVTKNRQDTMLERIGEAAKFVDNISYLPWFRSIQIKLEKMGKADEWGRMIEAASAKDVEQPIFYFRELCKRVKAGTYNFVEKVEEIAGEARLYLSDKLAKFRFGKYQQYFVHKANEFINVNGQAGFVELLEYAERKGISQKYMAQALINCKPPRKYYEQNIMANHNA